MQLEVSREFKESVCRMADAPYTTGDARFSNIPTAQFELPDGTTVSVGPERYLVPELLCNVAPLRNANTNANINGYDADLITLGLASPTSATSDALPTTMMECVPKLVTSSVMRCDAEAQASLLANLIMCGGGSCIEGCVERIRSEVELLVAPSTKVRHLAGAQAERPVCAWLGGSILGSLGSFHEMWISRQEYEETGAFIVDKKCP